MYLQKKLDLFLIPHIPLISYLLINDFKLKFGFIKDEFFDFCYSGDGNNNEIRYIHARTDIIAKKIDRILISITRDLNLNLENNQWKYGNSYLLNIPHSSLYIPKKYFNDYLIPFSQLKQENKEYTDLHINKLFSKLYGYTGGIINKYSRLFMDPERFFDDTKEDMAKYGLGWFYEKCILSNESLRTTIHKEEISHYYLKYHQQLETMVEKKLTQFNECSIIDCHSFSNRTYHFFDKKDFPDICIGFDEFHKDEKLIKLIKEHLSEFNISYNYPYSGSLVPLKWFNKDKRVKSTLIEINKRVYLNENHTINQEKYDMIQKKLDKLFYKMFFR